MQSISSTLRHHKQFLEKNVKFLNGRRTLNIGMPIGLLVPNSEIRSELREIRRKLPPRNLHQTHRRIDADKGELLSIVQISKELLSVPTRDGQFYFEPIDYRADKEMRLSQEARKILQKNPKHRTEKDIEYIHLLLRSYGAFGEFSDIMQKKLCAIGWYESYEPNRAIIRQDHPPHSFYVILSGTVIVTVFNREEGWTRTVAVLQRGMSFGELAVVKQSKRQATVCSETSVELLCISVKLQVPVSIGDLIVCHMLPDNNTVDTMKCPLVQISSKDFEDIFMAGGTKSEKWADHTAFLRNIAFLKFWPVDLLVDKPRVCMFHYFNRGQVCVRDTNQSEWIYIVKSGSLSVLKKLKEVKPELQNKSKQSAFGASVLPYKSRNKLCSSSLDESKLSSGTWSRARRQKLDELNRMSVSEEAVYKNQFEADRKLEKTLPGYYQPAARLGIIDYETVIDKHKGKIIPKNFAADVEDTPNQINGRRFDNDDDEEDVFVKRDSVRLPSLTKSSKGAYFSTSGRVREKLTRQESVKNELAKKQLEYDRKRAEREGRRTIADEFDNKQRNIVLTETDLHPTFIHVQILERGQYFGVANLIYEDQPVFSIVSNGAECIMISKRYFTDKASEATMRHIAMIESPFPSDEALQKNLQEFVNWRSHTKRLYDKVVAEKVTRKKKRKQFLPQYTGQYCFRTGPS